MKVSPENDKNVEYELQNTDNQFNRDSSSIGNSDKKKSLNDEEAPAGKFTKYLLFCLVIAVAGSGFQFGWSSAIYNTPSDVIKAFYAEVYYNDEGKPIDESTLNLLWSITNGLLPLGGIIGGFSSGFVADYFGRKWGLLLVNIFVVISATLSTISKPVLTYYTVMIGKFFAGVSIGLFSGILPLYLSECSSKNLRGLAGSMNQFSIVIGILVANVIGLPQLLGTPELWPYLAGLTFVPSIIHILLVFTSESPKYLFINKNNKEKAREVLMKLRENDVRLVEKELEELEEEKRNAQMQSTVTWGDLFSKVELSRALFVTVGIQISQQLSGINAVIFYSTDIFRAAGLKDLWPVYGTIILGGVQIVMTAVCMFIIDKAGRKILLLSGMIGMSLFSFLLAVCRIFGSDELEWLNYMTVVCAVMYIVFFSIGPGAIPWLITSELFNSDARGKATSIAVLVNWCSNLILTISFPFLEEAIESYSFFIFGVLLIFFSLFVLVFVPETKNKSIEEIVATFRIRRIFVAFTSSFPFIKFL